MTVSDKKQRCPKIEPKMPVIKRVARFDELGNRLTSNRLQTSNQQQ